MSARFFIRKKLGTLWPRDDFTAAENHKTLVDDLKSFNQKQAFTFSVLNHAQDRILGCIYITQPISDEFDVSVFIWVRKELLVEFYPLLLNDVKNWLSRDC